MNTYKEMKQQYNALKKTFDYMQSRKHEIQDFYQKCSPKSLTYIGCGSGYCLCQSGEMSAEIKLGIPARSIPAGDLMLNYTEYLPLFRDTLLIAPSRSGSTTEVIRAIENVKSRCDVPVIAISCVTDSALSKIAGLTLELPWAFDESVCQTRTVVNLYAANLLILAYISSNEELVENIRKTIEIGNDYMEKYEESLREIASMDWSDVIVLADGEPQGIAAEAALAYTEIAQISAKYYHLLDVRHGPMVLVNNSTLIVACVNSNQPEIQNALLQDLMKRGAKVITYSDLPVVNAEGALLQVTSGIKLDPAVRGIPFVFISQALACFKADHLGINPDNPDGIVAWVKL